MRIHRGAIAASLLLMASSAQADGEGFGPCRSGFADDTMVRTESRGDMTIGNVRVNDRVWSLDERIGRPGWSKIVRRLDSGRQYKLLAEFTEPDSDTISKTCWLIKRPL